jgi:hypothetical protein
MKIQKDNSKIALTQEIKDAEKRKREEEKEKAMQEIRKKQKWEETRQTILKDQARAERNIKRVAEPVGRRQLAYPPISEQLDMLWHDMDAGIIKVDKRRKGTWYRAIKEAKESTPINETWREDVDEARLSLLQAGKRMANNNLQGV